MKKLILFTLLSFSVSCFAQSNEETVSIPASQLTEQQKANLNVVKYSNYVGLGKEIGEAANGALSALTHQADTFSRTKLGTFTMYMIAYKVMGTDIIQFVIGVPLLCIVLIFSFIYYFNRVRTRRVIDTEQINSDKSIVRTYKIIEADTETGAQWIVWTLVFITVCIMIIFI